MKRHSVLFTVVEDRKKNPHHPPKIPLPLLTVEFPCFEVTLRRHNLQFTQEVSRPKVLYHSVGGGFKTDSPLERGSTSILLSFD